MAANNPWLKPVTVYGYDNQGFGWLHVREQVYVHAQLRSGGQRHCGPHGLLFPTFNCRVGQDLSSRYEIF